MLLSAQMNILHRKYNIMVSNTARHITYGRDLHTIPINDLEEILHGFHAKAPGQWYADCPSCGATGDHFSIAEIDGRRIFYCHKCQDKAKVWDALLELINDDDTSDSNTPHKEDIPVSIIRVKTDAPNPALQWYAKYCYTTVDKLLELERHSLNTLVLITRARRWFHRHLSTPN